MSGNNKFLNCHVHSTEDFIIKCGGKEVSVPRAHLCSLSIVFKAQLEEEPSMSFVELHPKYSNVLKEFRDFVTTLRCTVEKEYSCLFDDLLSGMDIQCDSHLKKKFFSPNKALENLIQCASDAGADGQAIMQTLLDE